MFFAMPLIYFFTKTSSSSTNLCNAISYIYHKYICYNRFFFLSRSNLWIYLHNDQHLKNLCDWIVYVLWFYESSIVYEWIRINLTGKSYKKNKIYVNILYDGASKVVCNREWLSIIDCFKIFDLLWCLLIDCN